MKLQIAVIFQSEEVHGNETRIRHRGNKIYTRPRRTQPALQRGSSILTPGATRGEILEWPSKQLYLDVALRLAIPSRLRANLCREARYAHAVAKDVGLRSTSNSP